ncbi:hypothetical protein IZY60_00350 [Lutibacter sp. B2]|nr:hypothetical protein [Lutibacter sp. B2]
MSFANQRNVLITDRCGSVYSFLWEEEKIKFIYFNKSLDKFHTITLAENATLEFDVTIDEDDCLYLVYRRRDQQMIIRCFKNGNWDENLLGDANGLDVFNLNIISYNQDIHILYCTLFDKVDMKYRIYHHFYDREKWNNIQVMDITKKSLLNPFQLIKTQKGFILGYYNVVDTTEQIFVKEFNHSDKVWEVPVQLTSSDDDKLCIDIIMTNNEILHLSYSSYIEENLTIKYDKYKYLNNKWTKVLEKELSNHANCMYPTFVIDENKLWTVWTEYDQIVSSFTLNNGISWNGPYVWKGTKENLFFRYKFESKDKELNNTYQLNHAFGKKYPEFSFIGFGSLNEAEEIVLKKKKEGDKMEDQELNKVEKGTKDIKEEKNCELVEGNLKENHEKDILQLEKQIEELESKMKNMEEYIYRRRRGIIFSNRNNKK